mgnify:CR=1 FL=1
MIAGTKYVGGHSDLMLGAVVTNDEAIAKKLNRTQYAMGYSISADDAWLALRGVRTMPIRMAQHARHALQVCEFFKGLPKPCACSIRPGRRIRAMRCGSATARVPTACCRWNCACRPRRHGLSWMR